MSKSFEDLDRELKEKASSIGSAADIQCSKLPLPKTWRIISGKAEWLDEDLGDRVIIFEKNLGSSVSSSASASPSTIAEERKERKEEVETATLEKETKKNSETLTSQGEIVASHSSKKRSSFELYRVALYNTDLLLDRNFQQIVGPSLVLFYRKPSSTREITFDQFAPYRGDLDYRDIPFISFCDQMPGLVSKIDYVKHSPRKEKFIGLTSNGSESLLWAESLTAVEFPVGCYPRKCIQMMLDIGLDKDWLTKDEADYFSLIAGEETLTAEQSDALAKANEALKFALEKDQGWEELNALVRAYHDLSHKKDGAHANFNDDFSLLAYDFACAIECNAPKRFRYALELLDINIQTLDWTKATSKSPYVFLALNKCCDLLFIEHDDETERRAVIKQYLQSFLLLLCGENKQPPDILSSFRRILSTLCGFSQTLEEENPLIQPGAFRAAGMEQLKDVLVILLEMINNNKKDFYKLTLRERGNYLGKIKGNVSKECLLALAGEDETQSQAEGSLTEKDAEKDKDKEKETKQASGSRMGFPTIAVPLPLDLKLLCGNPRNLDDEFIVFGRDFDFKEKKEALDVPSQEMTPDYSPVTHIALASTKRKVDEGQQHDDQRYRTLILVLDDPAAFKKQWMRVHTIPLIIAIKNCYERLSNFCERYMIPRFEDVGLELEKALENFLNRELSLYSAIHPGENYPERDVKHFSMQIGRMPKFLVKIFLEFLADRGMLPRRYIDFLLQFAGHERSYSEKRISRLNHYLSKREYEKAIRFAQDETLEILKNTTENSKPSLNEDDFKLWYEDSSLAFELAEQLEKVSPSHALEALKIIINLETHKGASVFLPYAMDNFCKVSLALFHKEGKRAVLEDAILMSLNRLTVGPYSANLESVFILVDLLEAYCGVKLVDRDEIRKKVADPEVLASFGDLLAMAVVNMTEIIHSLRKSPKGTTDGLEFKKNAILDLSDKSDSAFMHKAFECDESDTAGASIIFSFQPASSQATRAPALASQSSSDMGGQMVAVERQKTHPAATELQTAPAAAPDSDASATVMQNAERKKIA